VAPVTGVVTRNTTFVFWHTVAADTRVTAGVAGNAATTAAIAAEVVDTQFTPLEGTVAYTVTDLLPAAAPLTVNVPLPVPLAVPAVPPQVYVAPVTGVVTRNTTFVFRHTVAADTRVTAGVAGNAATTEATAPEVADTQFTPLEGAVAYTVTDLLPAAAPLTVNVPLPVPLAVPAVPPQVYVAPVTGAVTRNTTFVF
jgi:hypothetical protein